MKIVVLDGKTLAANDLDYNAFKEFGELTVYDNTSASEVIGRIADNEVILTNKVNINSDIMDACPSIKLIIVMATGYNVIDIDAARERGIVVTNIPAYSTNAVAQYVFACILNYTNKISEHNKSVQNGEWIASDCFAYTVSPLYELAGKTLGIVGFGAIGKAVAKLASAFGMNILVYSRTIYPQYEENNLRFVDLNTLLENSDFVSLHCPLTSATQNLISKEQLSRMKPSAMLINSSRGPVVNEQDLKEALENKVISAAALDVLCCEPMDENCPLYNVPGCVITPHIAWASYETRKRLMDIAIKNLEKFIEGEPQNVVNA